MECITNTIIYISHYSIITYNYTYSIISAYINLNKFTNYLKSFCKEKERRSTVLFRQPLLQNNYTPLYDDVV